jgi:hypothetical protein
VVKAKFEFKGERMFVRITILAIALVALASADTLTLRSGQVVRGQYVGGDARHIKFAVGDRVDTYSVDDVDSVQFGSWQKLNGNENPNPPQDPAPPVSQQAAPSPAPPSPVPSALQIPSGAILTVRMIDAVDSDQSRLGQTFRASVDEPILVDGQTVIARGTDATAKLVEDRESGKFEGRTILTLELVQVMANGRLVDITTGDVSQASGSRGAKTAKVVGGATALGAIVGALAGGGKGAAIGAGSGAAVGGGVQLLTHGERVRIPSEARLNFTLRQPVQL